MSTPTEPSRLLPATYFALRATLLATACTTPDAASPPTQPALSVGNPTNVGSANPLTLAVIGDTPYGPAKLEQFPALVDLINGDPKVDLVVHLGDIKAGSNSPCTDEYFATVRALFDAFKDPLVYTPGDNEWTDCHVASKNNGLFTPTERLAAVRAQSRVVFATLNVPGSNDDLAPWGVPLPADAGSYPSQAAERAARDAANLAWVDRAFALAAEQGSAGVVLMLQADMWDATSSLNGFDALVQRIGARAAAFGKPVLLLEGDSHAFEVQYPYSASSPLRSLHPNSPVAENVTRIVVEGSAGRTEYVRLTIDPKSKDGSLFQWERVPLVAPSLSKASSADGEMIIVRVPALR